PTVSQAGGQVFKHMSPWETFHTQATTMNHPVTNLKPPSSLNVTANIVSYFSSFLFLFIISIIT
ncbi:hypothetical protein ACQP3J_30440, partial [Escherichia coli]